MSDNNTFLLVMRENRKGNHFTLDNRFQFPQTKTNSLTTIHIQYFFNQKRENKRRNSVKIITYRR